MGKSPHLHKHENQRSDSNVITHSNVRENAHPKPRLWDGGIAGHSSSRFRKRDSDPSQGIEADSD